MLKRFWVLLSFVFLLSLAFSQDSLHMRFVGSWECPSDDLGGGGEWFARVRKILDDYLVLGAYEGDTLWILDVSDPSSPSVALCYADTAFSDEPALIEGFEVKKDSGYIYVAYRKPDTTERDIYVRILRLIANPLHIERGMIVNTPDNLLSTGSIVADSLLILAGDWNIGRGDTLISVEVEAVSLGYHYPPDGIPETRVLKWWDATGDSFFVKPGYITSSEWDTASPYLGWAAYLILRKKKFYSSDACSSITYGVWRTAYDDEMPTAAGISEEHGFVVLGTNTYYTDDTASSLYFVDIDSIIESYPCMPRARLRIRGVRPVDIVIKGDLMYVQNWRNIVVYDVSGYPEVDTAAYYVDSILGDWNHMEVDGRYIYEFFSGLGVGEVRIYELDSTVGVQGRIEREEELRIYPNPVFADMGRVRIVPQGVEGYAVDISGRVVKDIRNGEIEVDDLPPGIYLLNLKLGDKRYIKKILVI